MTRSITLAASLLVAAAVHGSVQYYLTDPLTSIDPTKWTTVGTLSSNAQGLSAPDPNGGALISRVPIPDGTSEAEVLTNITLNGSGGVYTEYLQASANAHTGSNGSGSYLAFEMQNPTFDALGHCTANFLIFQSIANSVRLLSSFQHACRNGMQMRFVVHGNTALAFPDQAVPAEFTITPGVGQPGIGSYGAPAGNAISLVQLGSIIRTPPTALTQNTVGVSAFRNHTDVQWKAVPQDVNGGLDGYWVYRDGNYFMRTTLTHFSDETVLPGASHSYAINAVDEHFNFSPAISITVDTPAIQAKQGSGTVVVGQSQTKSNPGAIAMTSSGPTAGSPAGDSGNGLDPRRTGVRALGAYWGASGENIDTTSVNLNFSSPLIRPIGRGSWGVPLVLSYNSQMWREDSGGAWLLGQDVGYGMGWKLQAGSIVPVWSGPTVIAYYLYTDATGAEYSLSLNNGNVWTSIEGVYVSYDANANVLYSPDGSFWDMGCQSSAGEQDAGTLYPTQMEDTNGNQLS
jgi:hypothetical protein